MSYENFASLVRLMRAKQTEFFKDHLPVALKQSEECERRVDAVLKQLAEGPGLFDAKEVGNDDS